MPGFWDSVWRKRTEGWVSGWLRAEGAPAEAPAGDIPAGLAYLNVFLKSARIVDVRRGLTTFYGAVHSYMRLPHRANQPAEFNVVTIPSALKKVDAQHLNRMIQMDQRLLGPVPYAGGDLEMEVGLFSIASADLAAPYLELLESLSKTAGVSFLSNALPFAGPILQGVKLLTSSVGDCFEIGLSRTYSPARQGVYVVTRAPKENGLRLAELKVDESDFTLLDRDGRAVTEYPYMIFEIRAETERADWFAIPEIEKAYSRVQDAFREQNDRQADAAVEIFRRVALTCNDLTQPDAARLAEKVQRMYSSVGTSVRSPNRGSGGRGPAGPATALPDLRELSLYGH
jgi:hypothetical protein